MGDYFLLAISCIFVNTILLAQYLGNCPFLGCSKKMETATGMATAVVFVLVLAGAITWALSHYILKPFDLEYLQTLSFILVIKKIHPGTLFRSWYIPSPNHNQLCCNGCLPYQHQGRVYLPADPCFILYIPCGFWSGSYSLCWPA